MRPMTVACRPMLNDRVRRHCAAVAASARHVRIDPGATVEAGGVSGLDPSLHFSKVRGRMSRATC